nr:hypothetical protein [Candidatus Enterousia merdequi]
MSRTKRFIKTSNQEIKHRPVYSKARQNDTKTKLQLRMMSTHQKHSR